jgi:O-antigen ligase
MAFTIKNKNRDAIIYTWLCIAIVYSLLFLTYLNSILSILLVVYWLIFSKKEFDIATLKTRLMLLFISLYAIGVVGLIYTNNIRAGIATLETQSAILFFPLVFGTTSVLDQSILKKITNHFLIAVALASVTGLGYGILKYFQTVNSALLTSDHILLFHVVRPVTMGLFCLLATIVAFEKVNVSSTKTRGWLYALIVLMTLMVFLLSIRLIIVCWLLIVFYYFLAIVKQRLYKVLLIISAVVLLITSAFAIPTVKKQWDELFDFSANSTITLDKDSSLGKSWGGKALRIAIWKCGADVLKKHWLIGVGTGDVQDSLQRAYENRKFFFASMYNKYNVHNEYLQITLANGLPGLLILLLCILYPLLNYRKTFSGNVYFLFLLLFAVVGMTESILEVNKGIIWYSFFNSIFAFGYLKSDKT